MIDLSAWKWEQAYWFIGILMVFLSAGGILWREFLLQKSWRKKFGASRWQSLTREVDFGRRKLKLYIYTFGLVLILLALARPQIPGQTIDVKSEGVDIILALDVSRSMLAEDVKPSRLQKMKVDMARLVQSLPGHRFGVLVFAGTAALLSPVTSDPAAVRMYIESLDPNILSDQGTNIADALKIARESLSKDGKEKSPFKKTVKVILLASDGEDHEPDAFKESEFLGQNHILLLSLSYGTTSGSKIPLTDSGGFPVGNLKNSAGEEVLSKVNVDELKTLASRASGRYFDGNGVNVSAELMSEINKFEKTEFDSSQRILYQELFQWFLGLAVVFFFVEMILSDRASALDLEEPHVSKNR